MSVPSASLRSAQHAAARPEYLCTAVLHGQCPHVAAIREVGSGRRARSLSLCCLARPSDAG